MDSVEVAARCGRQGRFASSTNAIVSKGALAGLRAGETGCGRTETGMVDVDVKEGEDEDEDEVVAMIGTMIRWHK